jgi:hypothetical protein
MTAKNKIIADLYQSKEFTDAIDKMEPEHLRDDLRQEVIVILLETPDERIIKMHEDGGLRFYTVRIILNLIKSNTSPFYKKYRGIVLEYDDNYNRGGGPKAFHTVEGDSEMAWNKEYRANHNDKFKLAPCVVDSFIPDSEVRIKRELQEDKALEFIETLYWYERDMVKLYLKLGNYRAIEDETNIPWESCYSTIRKVIKKVRDHVI